MAGMDSSGWPAGGAAAANSGIGSLGGGVYFRARFVSSSRDCTYGRSRRGQDGLARDLDIETVDLRLDLRLEFVGRALEFVERLADLAADLRQLLGPKNDQGQEEGKDHLSEAEVLRKQDWVLRIPHRVKFESDNCEAARSIAV